MTRLAPASSTRSYRSVPGALLGAVVGAGSGLVLVFYWALTATLVGGIAVTMPLGKALVFGLVIGSVLGVLRHRRDTPALTALLVRAPAGGAWLVLSGARRPGSCETGRFWGAPTACVAVLAAAAPR